MEENIAFLFQPDALLSYRYWETLRTKAARPPERMLMLAVLEDAVGCIRKRAHIPQSSLFRDAVDWILEEKSEWIFSFENICAVLELDANFIRTGLLHWSGKKGAAARAHKKPSMQQRLPESRR